MLDVLDNLNESILGGRSQRKGGGTGIKSAMRRLVAVLQDRSEVSSLFSGGQIEAAALVELHVPHTAHGLNLRLEGAKLVVVSVVAALKQILVSSVAGVLVSHPTSKRGRESFTMCTRGDILLLFVWICYSRSTGDPHAAHSVTEAMRPQGWHVILLDLHLVALEVGQLKQADLVLHGVLYALPQISNMHLNSASVKEKFRWPSKCHTMRMGLRDMRQSLR